MTSRLAFLNINPTYLMGWADDVLILTDIV